MTAERRSMSMVTQTSLTSQHPSRKLPQRTTMVGCGTRWREKGGGGALPLPQAQAATWAALPSRRGAGLLPLAISHELGTKMIAKMRAAPAHRTGKTTKRGPPKRRPRGGAEQGEGETQEGGRGGGQASRGQARPPKDQPKPESN